MYEIDNCNCDGMHHVRSVDPFLPCLSEPSTLTPAIVANRATAKLKSKTVIVEGRSYVLAKATLINGPRVMAGSGGRIYYPAAATDRSAPLWDGRPVVINHPVRGESANSPQVWETSRVGWLFNSKSHAGYLRADVYIDTEKLGKVAPKVLDRLATRSPLSISTGLRIEGKREKGYAAGGEYDMVANVYFPDHLAILPDQQGACSVHDGCSLLLA